MKKTLFALVLLALPLFASAQVSGSFWQLSSGNLKPTSSGYGLQVPSLANLNCLGTNATGVFGLGTCSGGGGGIATSSLAATFPITLNVNSSNATFGFGGLSTSTPAVQGNIPYFSGVNTFANVATTSVTCSGSTTCASFTVIGSTPITISSSGGSGSSLSTSSPISAGNVLEYSSTGAGSAFGIATGTLSGTSNQIAISATAYTLLNGATLSLPNHVIFPVDFFASAGSTTNATTTNFAITGPAANCNGTSALTTTSTGVVNCTAQPQGTVTSVTATYPILSTGGNTPVISTAFGTTTSWGIGNNGFFIAGPTGIPFVAASSTLNLPFSALPSVSANSVLGNATGASAAAASVATSSLFTYSAGLTQGSGLQKQIENRGFSYATSTAWTGTTTISLGVGYGEVWNTMKCYTDAGTLGVDFYHATTHFQFFNASTTIGTVNMGATTDTSGDKVKVDIGTPASSPTVISCTLNDTN